MRSCPSCPTAGGAAEPASAPAIEREVLPEVLPEVIPSRRPPDPRRVVAVLARAIEGACRAGRIRPPGLPPPAAAPSSRPEAAQPEDYQTHATALDLFHRDVYRVLGRDFAAKLCGFDYEEDRAIFEAARREVLRDGYRGFLDVARAAAIALEWTAIERAFDWLVLVAQAGEVAGEVRGEESAARPRPQARSARPSRVRRPARRELAAAGAAGAADEGSAAAARPSLVAAVA